MSQTNLILCLFLFFGADVVTCSCKRSSKSNDYEYVKYCNEKFMSVMENGHVTFIFRVRINEEKTKDIF